MAERDTDRRHKAAFFAASLVSDLAINQERPDYQIALATETAAALDLDRAVEAGVEALALLEELKARLARLYVDLMEASRG